MSVPLQSVDDKYVETSTFDSIVDVLCNSKRPTKVTFKDKQVPEFRDR